LAATLVMLDRVRAQEAAPGARQDSSLLQQLVPEGLYGTRFLGLEFWQWVGAALVVLVAFPVSWAVTWLVFQIARRLAARTETRVDDRILKLILKPFRYLLALSLLAVGSLFLSLPSAISGFLGGLGKAIGIGLLGWVALRLINLAAEVTHERLESQGRTAILSLIPMGRTAAKVSILAVALLAILQNLGFQVTGIVAGLGIGGLAVALAAQKTVENLFGGATILADHPVRVGDFCKFGNQMGTIEEIGLRSTRVRTLDRTVITVPNGEFAQTQIENYGVRDRIRLYLNMGLRYETSPEQLRHVLTGLRRILLSHPMVDREPARVRFVGFGACSLDLEIFAYVLTGNWSKFLGVREDIYLRFMDVVKESGTGFAFPSQTLYLGRDSGLDAEQVRRAESEVQAWRQENRLPFPAFSPDALEQMDDTLDWPPKGAMIGAESDR
jgi:MscS family membrane protein